MIQQARRVAAGLLCALLFLFCPTTLAGCGKVSAPASASAVLSAVCADPDVTGRDVPDTCAIYTRDAACESADYLSDTLFSALFGEAARGLLSGSDTAPAAINDAAVCISVSPTPFEIAVLRLSDVRGTATAAGVCRTRLDTVQNAWRGTEQEAVANAGVVTVEGSYVLLVIAPNPERVLRAARAAIRAGGS